MKIAIYGKTFSEGFDTYINNFFNILEKHNVSLLLYKPFFDYLNKEKSFICPQCKTYSTYKDIDVEVNYMISIGGDGTFLETVGMVRDKGIPIIGLNTGRLGFLSNIAKEEILSSFPKILNKEYVLESRSLIEFDSNNRLFRDYNIALNEVTIQKKGGEMITIHVYVNEEFLNSYWADGLIISTPTGSTAYSLSVGGPIVSIDADNFIISPIAPHNLTVRPIIVPDTCEITIKVEGRSNEFLSTVDYRTESYDGSFDIKLRKAHFTISTIKLNGNNFFTTLRNKLMWGADKRN